MDAIVFGFFRIFLKLMSVIISPFITTNELSDILSVAFLIAPPVPNGDFSIENSILQLKLFFFLRKFSICFDLYPLQIIISLIHSYYQFQIYK